MSSEEQSFAQIRARLEEIERDVKNEDIALDAALALYDEAVLLGTKAASMLDDVEDPAQEDQDDQDGQVQDQEKAQDSEQVSLEAAANDASELN